MAKYEAGFIGAGNMGRRACARRGEKDRRRPHRRGLLHVGTLRSDAAQRLGCTAETPQRILSDSRFVFLGVKPQMVVGGSRAPGKTFWPPRASSSPCSRA